MIKPIPSCKRFTGYKPCYPDHNCWTDGCKDNIPTGTKILIINLDAMGDVLMTTAQLPALKRKFPVSSIYWITLKISAPLLIHNQYIEQVFTYDAESLAILNEMKFDHIMNVDKSQRACALINSLESKNKLGFGLNEDGKIIPLNEGAVYNYNLGMDDHLKFKVNQRTGQDYLAETFELDYKREEYIFNFSEEEKRFINNYKEENGIKEKDFVIGFNTGCSNLYPNKKMTVEQHLYLIGKLLESGRYKIILLGGPEDTERNNEIYSHFEEKIINTPANLGVRRGACFENLADLIITGDSFGMHLGIALKKFIIVWFGVSCWTEIDLYDRGVKFFQEDLFCSPCWKKVCPYNLECIQMIDLNKIINEVNSYYERRSSGVH
jgi:ADP-heptose:LPS heptosyltransferase